MTNQPNKSAVNRGPDGRFLPNNNANPNGRPRKDCSLTSLIKKYLDEVPELQIGGKANTKTWRELLVQAWLVGAYKGNATLFKELLERIEGKVTQPIGGDEGKPIRHIIEVRDQETKKALGELLNQ